MDDNSRVFIPYLELGSAFVIGMMIGFVLKKSFKVLLFISGVSLIVVFYLEHQGTVNINEENLQNVVSIGIDGFQSVLGFLENRLNQFKGITSMSAIAGFIAGIKIA